ncbi:DUF1338 domain-containing protein [Massilia sp. W12]|uniref:DUF1338 domain-containing protein n=1 Tax=Massilia sp. W12 TaxID=3126507 RepID=UPI0030D44830
MNANIQALVTRQIGAQAAQDLLQLMHMPTSLDVCADGRVSRAELAQAMNMVLFDGILARVPTGRAYTLDVAARGGKVMFDHGALRTVRWFGIGQLPPGEAAFTRILKPLGFRLNGVFPLDRLGMTGRSYAHIDDPEQISQFFVSELHPERFSKEFQQTVERVLSTSIDPLTPAAVSQLNELERDGFISLEQAHQLLPVLVSCFARQHSAPALADYEVLLKESAEMAWIATEGNQFNHATDRVADVFALAEEQKAMGRPMKPNVEVSASGRIRQTAFKADTVKREFIDAQGHIVTREVPGSFYEFITRDTQADGKLDLGFDAGNATGIFKMTANAS